MNPTTTDAPRVTARAVAAGFSNEPIGTHTGKTMMLSELRLLLSEVPATAPVAEYRRVCVEANALRKGTAANRLNTFWYVKQLYGLDPDLPVFAAMRELWLIQPATQPLLALLCAFARDILLRSTAGAVLGASEGSVIEPRTLAKEIERAFPSRYSRNTLTSLGQHIASSWAQAGFLAGSTNRRRARPVVGYPAGVYALYLGHLEGSVGPPLLSTRWARMLDINQGELRQMAETAARSGWLEYRSSGGMTEMTFHHLDQVTGWGGA